jgi:hypothetical protein
MEPILQATLPVAPWMAPHTWRLPGTGPVALADWLIRDDVFAAQMACRDRLLAAREAEVLAAPATAPARELLAVVLDLLDPGYRRERNAVVRPDGVRVGLDGPPLAVAARLVQEDLLILEKAPGEAEHRLTAGALLFPSNWTLSEKLGMPLARIHRPVKHYDEDMAKRVQRLFDGMRPLAPLCRANTLIYGIPDLFNPRREGDRHEAAPGQARYIRVERQCLVKLPRTRAVVFTIHTFVVRPEALTPAQRQGLLAVRPDALGPPDAVTRPVLS